MNGSPKVIAEVTATLASTGEQWTFTLTDRGTGPDRYAVQIWHRDRPDDNHHDLRDNRRHELAAAFEDIAGHVRGVLDEWRRFEGWSE